MIVLVGSNLCIAHPIMWERISRNPHQPEIIVIDPRRHRDGDGRHPALAAAPKTDLDPALRPGPPADRAGRRRPRLRRRPHHGLRRASPPTSTAFTARAGRRRTPGVPVDQLEQLAATIAAGERVSFWWTMGVNQSHQGVRTAQAIIDLALHDRQHRPARHRRQLDHRPVQRHGLAAVQQHHQPVRRPRLHRRRRTGPRWPSVLGIDVDRIPDRPSLAYDQIIEGIHRGTIKGLWIIATNSAHSWINQTELRELLDRLDFLVVQDMYATTETAQLADLVLPAAGWGEKDGTFINSERRIGRIQRVAPGAGPGAGRLLHLQADRRGVGLRRPVRGVGHARGGVRASWPGCRPAGRATSPASSGYAQLDARRRPVAATRPGGRRDAEAPTRPEPASTERRLFADGRFFTPDGRARFVVDDPVPVTERPSARYPLVAAHRPGLVGPVAHRHPHVEVAVLRALAPARRPTSRSPRPTPRALGIEAERLGGGRVGPRLDAGPGLGHRRRCPPATCSSPCTTPPPTG